jgi:hypothetical protein
MKQLSKAMLLAAASLGLVAGVQAMPAGEAYSSHGHAVKSKAAKKGYQRVAAKKGGSGIGVQYRLLSKPAVGQPLRIALFYDGINGEDAKVSLKPDAQLSMVSGTAERTLRPSNAKGSSAANSHEITVTPSAEGLFYVNVFTEQGGRPSAAAVTVRVGDKPLVMPTTGTVKTEANGQRVISTPAQ